MSGTTFATTRRNSLKRDVSSGTGTMGAPSISAYSGYLRVTNLTIAHNLGYTPVFRYYYEPFKDGIIWPPLTDRFSQVASNPLNTSVKGPGIIGYADSTNLHLQLFYSDASLTGSYPIYWVIYKDFAL